MWKSDNQGVKEKTFTQTNRKGGDEQPGVENTHGKVAAGGLGRLGGGWRTRRFHICLQINWKEQLGSKTDHAT